MKKQVIKFWDKIIFLLLGILGVFSSCNKSNSDCGCEHYTANMYGVNYTDYVVIRGTVMNKANSKPIPNIRVITKINAAYIDTLYTNSEGYYDFFIQQSGIEKGSRLKFEDIDGESNGGYFATKEIDIKITKTEKEQQEECRQTGGTFTKIQNIKLETKK
jgi:putative lipoprotein (rSAM/lipoprotein system)